MTINKIYNRIGCTHFHLMWYIHEQQINGHNVNKILKLITKCLKKIMTYLYPYTTWKTIPKWFGSVSYLVGVGE